MIGALAFRYVVLVDQGRERADATKAMLHGAATKCLHGSLLRRFVGNMSDNHRENLVQSIRSGEAVTKV